MEQYDLSIAFREGMRGERPLVSWLVARLLLPAPVCQWLSGLSEVGEPPREGRAEEELGQS